MNIFLVEDNFHIIEGLQFSFIEQGYHFAYAKNKQEAIRYLQDHTPDLIILDVALPDGDGFDLYKQIIQEKQIATIFLTAKDDENDIVMGLELGADDYITKPFSTKELLVRVKKVLMRISKSSIIRVKGITFDVDKMTVTKDDILIELTALELRILQLLMLNKGKVITRDILLDKIWEWTGNDVNDHTITVYMKRIKDKLGANLITTVKGLGYRIDD